MLCALFEVMWEGDSIIWGLSSNQARRALRKGPEAVPPMSHQPEETAL